MNRKHKSDCSIENIRDLILELTTSFILATFSELVGHRGPPYIMHTRNLSSILAVILDLAASCMLSSYRAFSHVIFDLTTPKPCASRKTRNTGRLIQIEEYPLVQRANTDRNDNPVQIGQNGYPRRKNRAKISINDDTKMERVKFCHQKILY